MAIFKIVSIGGCLVSFSYAVYVRPDAVKSSYKEDINTMRLPNKRKWKNRPLHLEEELMDDYMTKQAFWLNPTYMYQQVKELFK
ncbi:hypothetical protein CON21_26205 [Bacillus thuringiensis]|nr:hypothetical protein CON21_26205 [Bacillus thuringiensis]